MGTMKVGEMITELHCWEVIEADSGTTPAFLMHQDDDDLQRALDIIARMKMHIEDVLSYRRDMEEYNDVP